MYFIPALQDKLARSIGLVVAEAAAEAVAILVDNLALALAHIVLELTHILVLVCSCPTGGDIVRIERTKRLERTEKEER
tara:strand:- start:121 stop:357 length:237 start_codon:yes stop_codon:yes gene_type:complete